MADPKQPGVKIDGDVWERFRDEVKRRRGGIRGHLKTELENALLDYVHGGDTTPNEINDRLQRIEAAVGVAGTDGGTDTFDAPEHTHTPVETPTEKPPANTATEKKVAWLAECVREETRGEFNEIARSVLVETVKDEYGFRSDTAKRYVEELIDYFDLQQHPEIDVLLVTSDRYDELVEQRRDQLREEAEENL